MLPTESCDVAAGHGPKAALPPTPPPFFPRSKQSLLLFLGCDLTREPREEGPGRRAANQGRSADRPPPAASLTLPPAILTGAATAHAHPPGPKWGGREGSSSTYNNAQGALRGQGRGFPSTAGKLQHRAPPLRCAHPPISRSLKQHLAASRGR